MWSWSHQPTPQPTVLHSLLHLCWAPVPFNAPFHGGGRNSLLLRSDDPAPSRLRLVALKRDTVERVEWSGVAARQTKAANEPVIVVTFFRSSREKERGFPFIYLDNGGLSCACARLTRSYQQQQQQRPESDFQLKSLDITLYVADSDE